MRLQLLLYWMLQGQGTIALSLFSLCLLMALYHGGLCAQCHYQDLKTLRNVSFCIHTDILFVFPKPQYYQCFIRTATVLSAARKYNLLPQNHTKRNSMLKKRIKMLSLYSGEPYPCLPVRRSLMRKEPYPAHLMLMVCMSFSLPSIPQSNDTV